MLASHRASPEGQLNLETRRKIIKGENIEKKLRIVIKYHSNHFDMASLAHNKKKAIQELSEQVMLYLLWQQAATQALLTVATKEWCILFTSVENANIVSENNPLRI